MRTWVRSHLITLALGAIVLLGAVLRLYNAGAQGIWLDEAFSIWVGSRPFTEGWMWLIRVDQHPPLYYTLLHFWLIFGDGEATVRLLSALLGVATIPVVFLLGRRLSGPGLGLVAAFILSISPFHVQFAQEARMYTLLTLAATLSITFLVSLLSDPEAAVTPFGHQLVAFWRAVRGPGIFTRAGMPPLSTINTDLRWLGYMLSTAAAVYTHNTAIFLPIAQNLFVFLLFFPHIFRVSPIANRVSPIANRLSQIAYCQPTGGRTQSEIRNPQSAIRNPQSAIRNWLLAQLGTLLLWSPWLPVFFIHSARVYREFWILPPSWQSVLNTLLDFSSAFLPYEIRRGPLLGPVFVFLFVMGLLHLRQRPRWLILLLLLIIVPFAGELLVSLRRPIFYTRTLIWTSVPYYVILASGIVQMRYRPYQLLALIVLVVINGFSLRNFYIHYEKEGWDQAAAYVAQEVEPDDLLLFNATWVQIPFDYYFKRYNKSVDEHGVPADLFDLGVLEPKMTEQALPRLRRLIQDRPRVWLIYSHDWYTDPEHLIPLALNAELSLLTRREFSGLQVYQYGAR